MSDDEYKEFLVNMTAPCCGNGGGGLSSISPLPDTNRFLRLVKEVAHSNTNRTGCMIVLVAEYGEGIAPTGYFTDEAFSEIWHHTELTRAGEWHEVRNDNFFMQDFAECRSGLPAGWRDGQITWRIPTAWGYVEEGEEVYTSAEFGEPYFQIFTLDTSGNFRVAKLGYWTERSPDGTRRRSENMEVQP